jgi:hypothetical protein
MNPWEGKHIWIWQLNQSGSPEVIVNRAVNLGLAGLLVKGWDGRSYWSQIEDIIALAHATGLIIGAWGYSYGTYPQGEAAAAKRCLDAGADWLIIDAEVEYEQNPSRAGSVLEAFRVFGVPLGYSSFGIPSYHSKFPWQVFNAACDVVLPQVYWGDFAMPVDKALSLSLRDCMQFGIPVMPAGQVYGKVAADEIVKFADLCKNAGLPGISYWDWQEAGEVRLEAVGAAEYGKIIDVVSDWAKAGWDKATAKGFMDGTNPQGVVTREMLAVILDRCGLLDAAEIPQSAVDTLKKEGIITSGHQADWRPTWGELAVVVSKLEVKK